MRNVSDCNLRFLDQTLILIRPYFIPINLIFLLAFHHQPPVLIVTKLMWEAIETPRPAAWRVIFKGLTLLEHLVKSGSERCVDDARNHSHLLRNLDKFNYYEGTVDRGVGVREKSKQVVEMLQDDDRIREERQKARKLREKFAGRSQTASSSDAASISPTGAQRVSLRAKV